MFFSLFFSWRLVMVRRTPVGVGIIRVVRPEALTAATAVWEAFLGEAVEAAEATAVWEVFLGEAVEAAVATEV